MTTPDTPLAMPKALRESLEALSLTDSGLVAEWLDLTPDADVQMVLVIHAEMERRIAHEIKHAEDRGSGGGG